MQWKVDQRLSQIRDIPFVKEISFFNSDKSLAALIPYL